MQKSRCSVFFILFLAYFLSHTSCINRENDNEGKTVFRYNESAGITTLDPAFARDQSIIWACNQLYNGLVQIDDSMRVLPAIAKTWEIDESGTKYTFYLRDDVRFHNTTFYDFPKDRVVKSSDFEYSFNRLIDPKVASPGSWVMGQVARKEGGFLDMETPSDTVLIINLKQAFPPFLGILSMQYTSVVPHEVVEKYGVDFRNHPVGTGAFRYKMWKEGVKLVLEKNPDYFEEFDGEKLPFIDAVAVTFVVDKQSAFLEFVKGNLDFLSGIDATYKDELLTSSGKLNEKYESRFKMLTTPYLNTEYLGFNVDTSLHNPQDNPLMIREIRQALNYGFDRRKMMQFLRNNIGEPAHYGMIPRGLQGFSENANYGYTYDTHKALELLKEAGFPNGKGLPPIKLSVSNSYLDLSQYIQSELSRIGVNIQIDVNPPATQRDLISQSKLDFFRGSWIADYPDAENYLSLFYSKNFAPNGPNYTHFSNAHFDKLYEKSQSIVNDSMRSLLYRQMDSIIMFEAPVIVLYYDQVVRLVQNNIEGLGNNPMNLLSLKKVKILQ
ncbi:MAG: ABC transporter substrate-binding protein [Bacteroidales bacterium]|mgnify:CR=1 FL=1|jgi:peptide/nickel transport system substrate-binding protein|nr:ABC transporter substrate-binding protein [Bacteroidales bacterium]